MSTPPLASTAGGTTLGPLLHTVLDALRAGAEARGGPLPEGGPQAVTARVRAAVGEVLPRLGDPGALHTIVHAFAAGAADPAHPLCAAHLHCPPLALATAADLAASALNPSLDSWDQAPAASALEALVTRALADEVGAGDALVTTGGTESNHLALLLARETQHAETRNAETRNAETRNAETRNAETRDAETRDAAAQHADPPDTHTHIQATRTQATRTQDTRTQATRTQATRTQATRTQATRTQDAPRPLRLVCGANAHHSLHRAAWLLGLPEPVVVPTPTGVLTPAALDDALTRLPRPVLVIATAGTTDAGLIDPLSDLADVCAARGARLHVDAAYGGGLLFSDRHRDRLRGLHRAHTITLDLHKLGWQPIAAGLLAVRDAADLAVLAHRTDYLNAADDTESGLPDLLGRSLRTTRRPDVLKIAVTLRSLGREGLGALVDRVCALAGEFAALVDAHDGFELYAPPTISTVLFRPTGASDAAVADIRRRLLHEGRAVLGRAAPDGRLWLKATLLNPHTRPSDLTALLKLVQLATPVEGNTPA